MKYVYLLDSISYPGEKYVGDLSTLAVDGDVWTDGVCGAIELMDVNFDGFDDIKLWTATSAGPNSGYGYWLYDPKAARFKQSDIPRATRCASRTSSTSPSSATSRCPA